MWLALTLSACGQDAPAERAAAPSPTPTAEATVKAEPEVRIAITSPAAGDTVKPTTMVQGKATPGTTVLLDGGCFDPGCQAIARATGKGRWSAKLRVGAPQATIEATTAAADTRDTVRVQVRVPPRRTVVAPVPEVEPDVTAAPRPDRVVLVGDSLAVGIEALLPSLLPGAQVSVDARTSRPMAEGMGIIARMDLRSEPTVLAVSLFTNDDPRNVDALESAVRTTVDAVAPDGCAVWATIVRPPFGGVSYREPNARLVALDAELEDLVVVPWAEQVAASPDLLAADGVHATPQGYQARASLYAEAIRSCGA